jgi:hypothetical protein
MTGWEVGSSVPSVSTIQSYETANPGADLRLAVSVGIFAGIVPLFRSPGTFTVSQADFWPPVSASRNSVPRGGVFDDQRRAGCRELGSPGGQKRVGLSLAAIIADLIRRLRTAGSIRLGHPATARLRCRVANDLRPRRARGLVRGTRAISSC